MPSLEASQHKNHTLRILHMLAPTNWPKSKRGYRCELIHFQSENPTEEAQQIPAVFP